MLFKLSRNLLIIGILIFGLIVNLLVYFNVQYLFLRAILSFLYITTIPGFLILMIMKVQKQDFWEYLVYAVGLSLAFIMFTGLAVNWILPLLHNTNRPLSVGPILLCFDLIQLIFGLVAYIRNIGKFYIFKVQKLNWLIGLIIITLYSCLGGFGAILLNNTGDNRLALFNLLLIVITILLLIVIKNGSKYYSIILYAIGLSVTLSVTLRSNYVYGSDIYLEYKVLETTLLSNHWSPSNLIDNVYNLCISITILPAIIKNITGLSSILIYKLLFPILINIIPVIIFNTSKKLTNNNTKALLSSLLYISFSSYIFSLNAHLRQGISFIFYILLIDIFLTEDTKSIKNLSLLLIYGISMVLCHYSTSYIAIGLLWLLFITKTSCFILVTKIGNFVRDKNLTYYFNRQVSLLIIIIVLTIFALFWYSQNSNKSNNIVSFLSKSISSINKMFNDEAVDPQSSLSNQFNLFYKSPNLLPIFEEYKSRKLSELSSDIYTREKISIFQDKINLIYDQAIQPNIAPIILRYIYLIIQLNGKLIKLFTFIGLVSLCINLIKRQKTSIYLVFLSISSFIILVAVSSLPFATINYDFARTSLQLFVILTVLVVTGELYIFKLFRLPNIISKIIPFLLVVIFFISESGLLGQIVGGTPPGINLNNYGSGYERYYLHFSELVTISWLSKIASPTTFLYAGEYEKTKITTYSKLNNISTDILPSTIIRSTFVYSGYNNTVNNKNWKKIGYNIFSYNFPTDYLADTKSIIYSTSTTKIYK